MPRIVREAELSWDGTLSRGAGRLTAASSGAFEGLPFSLPARVGNPEGKTSPEELLAAAHGGCFTMSLGGELAKRGATVGHLHVHCTITMDEVVGVGHQIVHSAIVATAVGEGVEPVLAEAAEAADEGCPFSQLLKAAGVGVEITATAGA
jgi:osmotically inducible protein OsmC